MNSMSTTDESIQQLHDTTTRHQTAINTIQATLVTQQNDIVAIKTTIADIRISINNIIHSLSDISAKLGFQISLPPPLPLSPMPPTPLPATVPAAAWQPAYHFLAPPTPSPVAAASAQTLPTTAAVGSKPLASSTPKISATQDASTPKVILFTPPSSALIRASNLKVTRLPTSFCGQQAAALILGNGKKMKYKGFCSKDYIFFFLSLVEYKIKLGEIKVLIFDPGGILDVKQLGWSLTLRTRSVSEGMVMIRNNDVHSPIITSVANKPKHDIVQPAYFKN